MALDLTIVYGPQVISSDPGYPYGKARNVTVSGDGTGTPWEAALVNDIIGFFQALLVAASATPSGDPDKVGASQYIDAIQQLIHEINGNLFVSGQLFCEFLTIASDETFFGGGHAIFKAGTHVEIIGPLDLTQGLTSAAQLSVNRGGIVIAPGAVNVGNGVDGLIIGAGGMRVFSGDSRFDDTSQFHAEMVFVDAGRIRKRIGYSANADSHIDVTQADCFVARSGIVTAARVYTIDSTGASDGSAIEFRNYTSFTMTLHNGSGATIGIIPPVHIISLVAYPGIARCEWLDNGTGSNWNVIEQIAP